MASPISAINYLSSRWGGVYEFLDDFTAQKVKAVSKASAHYLPYNLVLNKASHYEVVEKTKLRLKCCSSKRTVCTTNHRQRAMVF